MADGKVVIDTEIDSSGAKKDMNSLGSTLKKAGSTTLKATLAGVGAATTAIATMTKAAGRKSLHEKCADINGHH